MDDRYIFRGFAKPDVRRGPSLFLFGSSAYHLEGAGYGTLRRNDKSLVGPETIRTGMLVLLISLIASVVARQAFNAMP